ncbi:MAG TPA: acyl carrier protein [Blastocatellia bacterium]|jgi:D-alanine--poly(phosphoribitol) ligase subunit 2
MIDTLALQQQVTALFAEKLNLDVASAETDLIEAGLLDSLALVELLAQLEESFDVSISTDDMELENFRSITSIAMFVMQRAAVGVEV